MCVFFLFLFWLCPSVFLLFCIFLPPSSWWSSVISECAVWEAFWCQGHLLWRLDIHFCGSFVMLGNRIELPCHIIIMMSILSIRVQLCLEKVPIWKREFGKVIIIKTTGPCILLQYTVVMSKRSSYNWMSFLMYLISDFHTLFAFSHCWPALHIHYKAHILVCLWVWGE